MNMLWIGAGRGGELGELILPGNAYWHPVYEALSLPWNERKTATISRITIHRDQEHFESCAVHAIACHLLLGGMLSGATRAHDETPYIFPNTAAMAETSRANEITDMLRYFFLSHCATRIIGLIPSTHIISLFL